MPSLKHKPSSSSRKERKEDLISGNPHKSKSSSSLKHKSSSTGAKHALKRKHSHSHRRSSSSKKHRSSGGGHGHGHHHSNGHHHRSRTSSSYTSSRSSSPSSRGGSNSEGGDDAMNGYNHGNGHHSVGGLVPTQPEYSSHHSSLTNNNQISASGSINGYQPMEVDTKPSILDTFIPRGHSHAPLNSQGFNQVQQQQQQQQQQQHQGKKPSAIAALASKVTGGFNSDPNSGQGVGQRPKVNPFYAPALPVFPLPPLPPILDKAIETKIYTHTSLHAKANKLKKEALEGKAGTLAALGLGGKPKGVFEDPVEMPAMDYEKLEHCGDSILGMIITTWLHEIKPRLTIGTATKLKSYLVSNATLSHLSTLYSLPARLEADPATLPIVRAQPDIRAALFEAYIAGVYYSHPLPNRGVTAWVVLDKWLREVYGPLMEFFYSAMKKEHEAIVRASNIGPDGEDTTGLDFASMGMSSLLAQYCSKRGLQVTYKEEKVDLVQDDEEDQNILEKRKRAGNGNLPQLTKTTIQVDIPDHGPIIAEAIRWNKKTSRNVAAYFAAQQLGIAN